MKKVYEYDLVRRLQTKCLSNISVVFKYNYKQLMYILIYEKEYSLAPDSSVPHSSHIA